MGISRSLLVCVVLVALPGCESYSLSSGQTSSTAGIEQSFGGRSSKTFPSSVRTMRLATIQTLRRMGMPIKKERADKKGWVIESQMAGRDVDIELERISRRTTRMEVLVERGVPLLGDSASSAEIIVQTSATLQNAAN